MHAGQRQAGASSAKTGNFATPSTDWTCMFDSRAAQLQQQAIEALSDLRTWIWGRHAELLPDDLAGIGREDAERYAAYLDWYSRVEEVMLALVASGALVAPLAVEPAAEQPAGAPAVAELPATTPVAIDERLLVPTVRAPSSYAAPERSNGWQRVISVLGTLEELTASPRIKAA
jgi:hypothetical protein